MEKSRGGRAEGTLVPFKELLCSPNHLPFLKPSSSVPQTTLCLQPRHTRCLQGRSKLGPMSMTPGLLRRWCPNAKETYPESTPCPHDNLGNRGTAIVYLCLIFWSPRGAPLYGIISRPSSQQSSHGQMKFCLWNCGMAAPTDLLISSPISSPAISHWPSCNGWLQFPEFRDTGLAFGFYMFCFIILRIILHWTGKFQRTTIHISLMHLVPQKGNPTMHSLNVKSTMAPSSWFYWLPHPDNNCSCESISMEIKNGNLFLVW
jgi:hypothetical protein